GRRSDAAGWLDRRVATRPTLGADPLRQATRAQDAQLALYRLALSREARKNRLDIDDPRLPLFDHDLRRGRVARRQLEHEERRERRDHRRDSQDRPLAAQQLARELA